VSTWIAQVQGEKLAAQQVVATTTRTTSTAAEIRQLIEALSDARSVLDTGGETKAELYGALGLNLTYKPKEQVVDVVAVPTMVDVSVCRRGDLHSHESRYRL
jgi:glycosyltransferase A (GT-A) superfamily protein (DUF2064 family)